MGILYLLQNLDAVRGVARVVRGVDYQNLRLEGDLRKFKGKWNVYLSVHSRILNLN